MTFLREAILALLDGTNMGEISPTFRLREAIFALLDGISMDEISPIFPLAAGYSFYIRIIDDLRGYDTAYGGMISLEERT